MSATLQAAPATSTMVTREVGNAWGQLQADRPLLSERLGPLTGYSQIIVAFLRAVDLYQQTYSPARMRIDTWRTGDQIRHRFDGNMLRPGKPPELLVGPEWLLSRTTRLAGVVADDLVVDHIVRIVDLLDGWVDEHGCQPKDVAQAAGYPLFIRGLTYVVHQIEIP